MVVVAAERESFSRTKAMLAMKRLEFLLSYVETEATQKGRFDSESAYFRRISSTPMIKCLGTFQNALGRT